MSKVTVLLPADPSLKKECDTIRSEIDILKKDILSKNKNYSTDIEVIPVSISDAASISKNLCSDNLMVVYGDDLANKIEEMTVSGNVINGLELVGSETSAGCKPCLMVAAGDLKNLAKNPFFKNRFFYRFCYSGDRYAKWLSLTKVVENLKTDRIGFLAIKGDAFAVSMFEDLKRYLRRQKKELYLKEITSDAVIDVQILSGEFKALYISGFGDNLKSLFDKIRGYKGAVFTDSAFAVTFNEYGFSFLPDYEVFVLMPTAIEQQQFKDYFAYFVYAAVLYLLENEWEGASGVNQITRMISTERRLGDVLIQDGGDLIFEQSLFHWEPRQKKFIPEEDVGFGNTSAETLLKAHGLAAQMQGIDNIIDGINVKISGRELSGLKNIAKKIARQIEVSFGSNCLSLYLNNENINAEEKLLYVTEKPIWGRFSANPDKIREFLGRLKGLKLKDPIQISMLKDSEDNNTYQFYIVQETKEKKSVCQIYPLSEYSSLFCVGQISAIIIAKTEEMARIIHSKYFGNISEESIGWVRYYGGWICSCDNSHAQSVIYGFKLLYRYFNNSSDSGDNARRYCYLIPDIALTDNQNDGNSFAVIATRDKLSYLKLRLLVNCVTRFFSVVNGSIHSQLLKIANIKSAIGSIMSRNGSHNIGSHVLAALSHNVGTMPDDRVLYQYIQHRMDYIATAVGELPSWAYSTKFVGGVIREFLSQRHLLEYISKSEGLQAFKFQDPNHIGNNRFNQKNTIRLHVRRSDYGLPKGVNEVDFIEYSETNDDVQQRLQYDIDVALPGGVVGGHAFFTILENVIRNAAKHGWATKRDTERKDENLDIYVDFKRDEDCQNATVVVYDGISDVLSVLDEEKSNDVGERNGIRKLKDWIEANRETLCSSLDKKSLEQLKAYIEDKGENLPIPYGGLVNVLSESVDCGGDNNGKKKKVWEVIKGNLAGKTDSDKELGHRLWLPLHHSHQIKLATPFIDDAGSLRRENWGLAEMKISAGYLQMRTISEIGGLDSDVNGYDGFKKIITPVCVKHVSFSKDGKKETHHHLGYEFKIRCPRELLFVVQGERPSGDAAKAAEQILLRHGVHIRYIEDSGYDAVFALQNNPSRLEWDFRYVMLPVFPQVPNPKLPFRVLTGERSCKWCVPHFQEYSTFRKRLKSVLAGAEDAETWVHDLKKAVYKAWLAYWQSGRRKDIGKPVLSLVVDPGGGSGDGAGKRGGECLISDSDLWSVVLDNLFRTLVRQHLSLSFGHELEYRMKCHLVRIAVSDTREMLSDFDVSRPRYSLGRQIAAWFEKSNFGNISKDEILKKAEILKPLAEDFMVAGNAIPRQECDKILGKIADGDYAAEIQQFHSSLKEWLRKCKNAKSSSEHDFEAPQVEVNGKSYNYPGFQKFMDSCLVAFEHSAVFLRKYEERIATLPESFQVKASGGDGTSFVNATAQIGIDAVTGGSIPESRKAIRYERHFDAGAFDRNTMAYAEPLSGTQTYLNMLGQLVGNNDCPIETVYSVSVSLMENALTRILIIDERTADFLKKHELSKQTYAHMGVWVLDDKTIEGCTPPQKSPDNKEWNPNVEQALLSASDIGVRIFTDMANCDDGDGEESQRWRKFDIVVIHQGLIDKWLSASAHDAKGVESLLERLKERVPYVVITTGRGTPSNTPATARILPFSVIEKTMFRQSPEKMILVDTVMNILPVGERKQ